MKNAFHPEHDQLLEFSAGGIDPSLGLCVSVHLENCEVCRQQLTKMDTLGGFLFESLEPSSVSPALFDKIMNRIDEGENISAGNYRYSTDDKSLPKSIRKLTGFDVSSLNWKKHGGNVSSAELLNSEGIKASLIRIKAGATIPHHDHTGREFTVILEGSFSDCNGVYHKGDFLVKSPGEIHSPTATTDMDCLCLAVLEAPLKFNNHMYELFNKLNPL